MDWALALASQGLEAWIAAPDWREGPWRLLVDRPRRADALAVIRQYRRENRTAPAIEPESGAGAGATRWRAGVLVWAASMAWIHSLGLAVERFGMRAPSVRQGEWWRVITATWIHADIGHLALNLAMGVLFLGLAMGRLQAGVALLGSMTAGLGGNLLSLQGRPGDWTGLGASGVTLGALGLLAVPAIRSESAGGRGFVRAIASAALLAILIGADPQSDRLAHAGGFLTGCVLGAVFGAAPNRSLRSLNRWCWFFYVAVNFAAWGWGCWRALASGPPPGG